MIPQIMSFNKYHYMDAQKQMIDTLRDMDVDVENLADKNIAEVTGTFLKELGVEPEFVLNNIVLIQTLNENPDFLQKVSDMCVVFP